MNKKLSIADAAPVDLDKVEEWYRVKFEGLQQDQQTYAKALRDPEKNRGHAWRSGQPLESIDRPRGRLYPNDKSGRQVYGAAAPAPKRSNRLHKGRNK